MTDEKQFEQTIRARIAEAQQLTGHSFSGLLKMVDNIGAVKTARRLIAPGNVGKFPIGMRVLFQAERLDLSVEQAVIEFGKRGAIFTPQDATRAKGRLQLARVLLRK